MKPGPRETPYLKEYHMQKATAKQRGVPFNLTFKEWRDWWGTDVDKRGRNRPDAMVMALINTEIGYQLDNIVKRTKSEHSGKIDTAYLQKSQPVHTPHGEFDSMNKAAKALDMYVMTVRNRCLSTDPRFTDWYYIKKEDGE